MHPSFSALFQTRALSSQSMTRTLAELVSIDSVNPSYGGPTGGEARVIAWVEDYLTRQGVACRRFLCADGRPNLRVVLPGQRPGPSLLFQTHVDTVSLRGMTIDPLGARVEDGRLWGRGATDAKAQVTAMVQAMLAWVELGLKPERTIELALCCDEEHGFGGAEALLDDGVDSVGIVIGEPTDLRVVCTHKGCIRLRVHLHGLAAHSSRVELGANAISAAAALVREIDTALQPRLQARRTELLRPPTLNVSLIHGGTQINMVPDACTLDLDRRTLPGETVQSVMREVEDCFEGARRRFPAFQARLEEPTFAVDPMETSPHATLVTAAGRAAAQLGLDPEPVGVDYATDACALSKAQIPIIVVGPGSIGQAHTPDEWMDLAELVRGGQYFARLMAQPFETLEAE